MNPLVGFRAFADGARLATDRRLLRYTLLPATIITTEGLSYTGKKDALTSLLKSPNRLNEKETERLRWLLGEIHKYNQLRNNIAHHDWTKGLRPDSIKPMHIVVRGGAGKYVGLGEDDRDYTKIELCEIADELNDLYRHFVQFIDESGLAREVERKIDVINPSTSESPGIPKAK